jgi:hypothetical protein
MTDPRFSIIPAAAVTDPRLEGRDLQVLCLFGRHIDRNGWCRRSQVKMASELGCARSTLQASIERLVEAGWLIKRGEKEDVHAPGARSSAFEYRVMLDTPDVVSTGADQSAGGADPERQGVPPYASAPMLTTPLNDKKEARTRSGPTEGLGVDCEKVKLHCDDPVFREIVRLKGGKQPPTDRNGYWTFKPDLVAKAKAGLAESVH